MAEPYKGLQQNMPHGKRSIPVRHVLLFLEFLFRFFCPEMQAVQLIPVPFQVSVNYRGYDSPAQDGRIYENFRDIWGILSLEIRAGAFENPKDHPSVCSLLKSHGFKNADFGRIGNALLLKGLSVNTDF